MKILILGKNGMLGHAVCKEFQDSECDALGEADLDITDEEKVHKVIGNINPDAVVNCAAYTDVDGCETNREEAFNVNGRAVGYIAEACNKIKANMVHISTDYVFDGKNRGGYKEDAKKNPMSIYGKSKALGEDMILKNLENFSIIRTAWLFGEHGKNFVNAIINLSKNKDELKVVNDQLGSPTYTRDLASMIKKITKKNMHGIFHVTNSGYCTWYQFACKILELTGKKNKLIPISSKDLNRLAERPKCSILINNRLDNLRGWEDALKQYLKENFL